MLRKVVTGTPGMGADGVAPVGLPVVDIGVLSQGKPTLAVSLASILLQDACRIRVFLVDINSDQPVIQRDDVLSVVRLAGDRGIPFEYQQLKGKDRRFSRGRLRLVEELDSPYLVLMDDDVVLTANTMARMLDLAARSPVLGYVLATCQNAGVPRELMPRPSAYAPGSLVRQDAVVRRILHEYYRSTGDVLDQKPGNQRALEIAFMTELFAGLERDCLRPGPDAFTYHLDYHQRPDWGLVVGDLWRASRAKARELTLRHARTRRLLAPGTGIAS